MQDIALITARAARALDEDLPPLADALTRAGVSHDIVSWDDPSVAWHGFRVGVLRSTWDYADRFAEFRQWLLRAERATTLVNPPAVVRWSTDKHYLAELAARGVPTVPTAFVDPGAAVDAKLAAVAASHACRECVVKPAVGAGSRDAARYGVDERARIRAHVERLLRDGRTAMLQPYLDRVDDTGETALIFFDGVFSHGIRKGPLLPPGGTSTDALFAAEDIRAREATPEEREVAGKALAALPFGAPLAYARVDLIRDADDRPVLLELELAEPSLFFAHAPGSADRFAAVLARRL
jgi:O-ureido-D-serine cyclo-ligase